jgi:hypothetical protein
MAKNREAAAKSPLGELLALHRGNTSVRKAAARADISEGRWRQIEAGYESKGGMRLPVNARPETVAAMARAVGADVSVALKLAEHDPGEYPELLDPASAEASGDDPVRDAIATTRRVDAAARELLLALYDREVERKRAEQERDDRRTG